MLENSLSEINNLKNHYMQNALTQAKIASQKEEIPVGAVIIYNEKIVGVGYNQPISQNDPTAHAEIMAIRDACKTFNNYRLPNDCTLYVTLEPCTMCVGALIHARINHVVFGATEPRAGSLQSAQQLMQMTFYNHFFSWEGGVLAAESQQLLKDFFKQKRQKS